MPLVSQSCLFDLGVGDKHIRPDGAMAYQACENAGYDPVALSTSCAWPTRKPPTSIMPISFIVRQTLAGEIKNLAGEVDGGVNDVECRANELSQSITTSEQTLGQNSSNMALFVVPSRLAYSMCLTTS